MFNDIFIYEPPFLVKNTRVGLDDYLLESFALTEWERDSEEKIRGMILNFALDHQFLNVTNLKGVTPAEVEDTGSWKWLINYQNFRSLVDLSEYGKLMASLGSNNEHYVTLIIDLHVRLGLFFDPKILNTVVNRVMRSIQMIPWPQVEDKEYITWQKIHEETPFIWILIMMQAIMRNEIGKSVA